MPSLVRCDFDSPCENGAAPGASAWCNILRNTSQFDGCSPLLFIMAVEEERERSRMTRRREMQNSCVFTDIFLLIDDVTKMLHRKGVICHDRGGH